MASLHCPLGVQVLDCLVRFLHAEEWMRHDSHSVEHFAVARV